MVRSILFACSFMVLATPLALGQEFTATQSVAKQVPVQNEDGSVTTNLVSAERVVPGEQVFYELVYDNGTAEPAENVSLVMAVPPEVQFQDNSAASETAADIAYSTNGGDSFAQRAELTVDEDSQTRAAGPDDITHVRWTFAEPVEPGETGTVGFQAIVR